MLAVDFTADLLPFVVFGGMALAIVVWLAITRHLHQHSRRAARVVDVGGADMSPEDQVKHKNQHHGPGATDDRNAGGA